MGGRALMPDIVTYLSARPGEPVALAQLAAGVGVEPTRVQKALSNAISTGVYGATLECVHRGQVYKWNGGGHAVAQQSTRLSAPVSVAPVASGATGPATPQGLRKGEVVEVMGMTREGDAVASDENGRLYRVMPL